MGVGHGPGDRRIARAGRARDGDPGHFRGRATRYIVVACVLLFGLAALRLVQFYRTARLGADSKIIVLDDPVAADLWFEIRRQVRATEGGRVDGYLLVGSAPEVRLLEATPGHQVALSQQDGDVSPGQPATLKTGGHEGNVPEDGVWLEDGAILEVGALKYRVDLQSGSASNPTIFRWPLAEVGPSGGAAASSSSASTVAPSSQQRPDPGRNLHTSHFPLHTSWSGWRRFDLGGNPEGEGTVRDRLYIPWERVSAALPPEVAAAHAGKKGVASILPLEGEFFRPGDETFRIAAEIPGLTISRPGGEHVEVPVRASMAGERETLPQLGDGDTLFGPGFTLLVGVEVAPVSEPVLDRAGSIVAYSPKRIRYLTFREAESRVPGSRLVGGSARLEPVDSGGAPIFLSGADRFLLVGQDRLLGRFRTGPIPSRLPDREFLALTREAFAEGILYYDRGFLVALEKSVLDAVEALETRDGAPGRDTDLAQLEAFLAPLAQGEGQGEETSIRAAAAVLSSRLRWEPVRYNWGLSREKRDRAGQLLENLRRTSGQRLAQILNDYNRKVVPVGLWSWGALSGRRDHPLSSDGSDHLPLSDGNDHLPSSDGRDHLLSSDERDHLPSFNEHGHSPADALDAWMVAEARDRNSVEGTGEDSDEGTGASSDESTGANSVEGTGASSDEGAGENSVEGTGASSNEGTGASSDEGADEHSDEDSDRDLAEGPGRDSAEARDRHSGDTTGEDWLPAVPGDGVGIDLPVPFDEGASGRWHLPPAPWQPAFLPPGTKVAHTYQQTLDLPSGGSGWIALAAPGYLELEIDGTTLYQGPGMGSSRGPGTLLPLDLPAGRHTLTARVTIVLPERGWPGSAGVKLETDDPSIVLADARGAGWHLPEWESDATLRTIERLWRPLVPVAVRPGEVDESIPQSSEPITEDGGEWIPGEERAPDNDLGAIATGTPAGGEAVDVRAEATRVGGTGGGETGPGVEGGDGGGDVRGPGASVGGKETATTGQGTEDDGTAVDTSSPASADEHIEAQNDAVGEALSLGTWLWVSEPASLSSSGGVRYLLMTLRAEEPGVRTLELTTTALPRRILWNGSPIDGSGWPASAPSHPIRFSVPVPAGLSFLRLELEQAPVPSRRVADNPVVLEEGRPARFQERLVTLTRSGEGADQVRAPIVDRDGYSLPALVVEHGYGALSEGLEVLLGEHDGSGDKVLYLPSDKDKALKMLEIPEQVAVFYHEDARDAQGHPVSFVPSADVRFFRQEDPVRPPFLPFGDFRVRAGRREFFRDDRDMVVCGDYRLEYVSSHPTLVQGDRVFVTLGAIYGLKLDGFSNVSPFVPGESNVVTPFVPGEGEMLRLSTTADGVFVSYSGAPEGARVYRAGEEPLDLMAGETVELLSGDRLSLPQTAVVLRFIRRLGMVAPLTPAAALDHSGGERATPGLGLDRLVGRPGPPGSGIEQVFDNTLTGRRSAPTRVRLTLDDDLQRYARNQLLRQLALLRTLGLSGVENEDGVSRGPLEVAREGALILMDARTGAILAAVSEPDSVPGKSGGGTSSRWTPGGEVSGMHAPWGRAAGESTATGETSSGQTAGAGSYGSSTSTSLLTWQDLRCHPGSTFKLVTALAALESEDPTVRAFLRGELTSGFDRTGGRTLKGMTLPGLTPDARPIVLTSRLKNFRGAGVAEGTRITQAIEKSLNTYFGYVSLLLHRPLRAGWGEIGVLGDEAYGQLFPLYGVARRFGFNEPFDLVPETLRNSSSALTLNRKGTSIDTLGRTLAPGDVLVVSASRFPRVPLSAAEIANVGIGQGEVYVTPLQMALVASVYATGGTRPTPYLIDGIGPRPARPGERVPGVRVAGNPSAVAAVRAGMKAVVEKGSAAGAFSDNPLAPYIFGKTGTAERPVPGGGAVDDAWFVGFIVPPRRDASSPHPAHHELAFACQIPAAGLGGRHAAEVLDRFLRDVARYYGWVYPEPRERRVPAGG